MTFEEKILYRIIADSGNKGVWIKDIKTQSNMHTQVVSTTIKSLEKKLIIKSVKLVKNSIKKVFMLYDMEPSEEVTGGPWYTDQSFDSDFVDHMMLFCFRHIQSMSFPSNKNAIFSSTYKGYATISTLQTQIKKSQITQIDLSKTDIKQLVDALIFDGRVVEKNVFGKYGDNNQNQFDDADFDDFDDDFEEGHVKDSFDNFMFVAIKTPTSRDPYLSDVPCGKCPRFNFCHVDGPINPANCEYFQNWFESW